MGQSWVMMLNGGGMRSLVASAAHVERCRVLHLYVHDGRAADTLFHQRFIQQGERYGVSRRTELLIPHLIETHSSNLRDPSAQRREPLRWQQMILAAAGAAIRHKAQRLIWPIQVGRDADHIGFDGAADVAEHLILLRQMIELEYGRPMHIETPLLEVIDRQLIEIGHQMDVPWELARSCVTKSADPCGECLGCERRAAAFDAAGLEDPLPALVRR